MALKTEINHGTANCTKVKIRSFLHCKVLFSPYKYLQAIKPQCLLDIDKCKKIINLTESASLL